MVTNTDDRHRTHKLRSGDSFELPECGGSLVIEQDDRGRLRLVSRGVEIRRVPRQTTQ